MMTNIEKIKKMNDEMNEKHLEFIFKSYAAHREQEELARESAKKLADLAAYIDQI